MDREELQRRLDDLRTLHQDLLNEALADQHISPDEQAMLDVVAGKLAEVERHLAAMPEERTGGMFSDALDAVTDMGENVLEAAGAAAGAAADLAQDVAESAAGVVEEARDTAQEGARTATDVVENTADAVGEFVEQALETAGDTAEAVLDFATDAMQTFAGTALEVANAAQQAAMQAAAAIAGTVHDAIRAVQQRATATATDILTRAQGAADLAESIANEAEDAAGDAVDNIRDRAQEAANQANEAAAEAAEQLAVMVAEAEAQARAAGQQVVAHAESAADQAEAAIDQAAEEARDAAEDAGEQIAEIEQQVRDAATIARQRAQEAAAQLEGLVSQARQAVEEAVSPIIQQAQEAAARAEEAVRRITGTYYTEEENVLLDEFAGMGLDEAEREALVDLARTDPAVIEQARTALGRMDELSVPAGDRGELIRLVQTNAEGFDAAMTVIADMESGGPLDVSDTAMADLSNQIAENNDAIEALNQRYSELMNAGAPQAELDALDAEFGTLFDRSASLETDFEQREDKRGLLDALSFGPLAVDRPDPIPPEDTNALIEAYGRNPDVADTAIELAGRAEDPGLIAQNVAGVLDVTENGFAPPGGEAIDENYVGEFDAMAGNMLRNGLAMGQEYFDGAEEYYASGAQTAEDPNGGRSGNPVGDINQHRTANMGASMLNDDGEVDVTSSQAQASMDHMLYHPGSLAQESYSPNQTAQMQGVYDMFTNPETATDAAAVINGVEAPDENAPNEDGARNIVGQTMGVDPRDVTDHTTRSAVLSGMLTPFQQGSVGSCFATGPTRRLSIEDPVQTMRNMAEIATTGQFMAPGLNGVPIPANQNIPDGENPMMRSYEFTVAAGSAMVENSWNQRHLDSALWDAGDGGRGLGEIEGMVGSDAWNGTGEVDENGDLVEGVRSRLQAALAQQLRFDYNARELDTSGGSSDGSSSHGVFEIIYQGSALDSEDAFQNAIQQIALGAVDNPDQATQDAITELVQSDAFVDSIYAAYGTNRSEAPWNLAGGGFGRAAERVLTGTDQPPAIVRNGGGSLTGNPTEELLSGLVSGMGDNDGLTMLSTNGTDANHAFMGTANDPSFQALVGPDSEERIQQTLIEPGEELAARELPEQQVSRMYESQIRDMMTWRNVVDDPESVQALRDALGNGPSEAMTSADYEAFLEDQLEDFNTRQRAYEGEQAEEWRNAQTEPVTDADVEAHRAELQERNEGWTEEEMTSSLLAATDPPYVVIADTNWGDHDSQTQFVVGPDPRTGELRIFARDTISGELSMQGENWETATWRVYE